MSNDVQNNQENPELADLGTHMAGAVNSYKTRTTDEPVQINPPENLNPGPYDNRDQRFDNKENGKPI
ncbi:hypothetical protein RAC89_08965 [Paenibacillus sp. GD4]|uniref:hypothetical protein n=1 Tax=Paenibacillus TaxID=44249 RepID=UPI002542D579|nr:MULTISPECIES: hypothetical protein [Paenibacillus]MDQ1910631.1 hypothetical protein [Paenibacillus sp. GD4]